MAYRSPVLGYNHNISHRGLVFHVQTEDSGVSAPHIFTHLFYGGVVLNTRKLDYDAEAAEESVKALMQAQHKSTLKRLKRGEFDDKIYQYFGDNPDLEPRESAPTEEAAASSPAEESAGKPDESSEVSAAFDAIKEPEAEPPPAPPTPPPAKPARAAKAGPARVSLSYSQSKQGRGDRVTKPRTAVTPNVVHDQPTMPVQRARPLSARPAGKSRRVSERVGEASRRGSPSVVVSRPAVIIGAPSKVVGSGGAPAASRPRPRRFAREESSGGLFGKEMVSEKSLDEVILAYLSEDPSEE